MLNPIYKNLYICSQEEYEMGTFLPYEWSFLLAGKEPWHRSELRYTGRACDKSHPEYLYARRGNRLILNLVDAGQSIYFDKGLIDTALNFIEEELRKDKKVLIVCNMGMSRSASLGLLYLIKHNLISGDTLEDVEVEYLRIYPKYNPGEGIRGFVKENWNEYYG